MVGNQFGLLGVVYTVYVMGRWITSMERPGEKSGEWDRRKFSSRNKKMAGRWEATSAADVV